MESWEAEAKEFPEEEGLEENFMENSYAFSEPMFDLDGLI